MSLAGEIDTANAIDLSESEEEEELEDIIQYFTAKADIEVICPVDIR
jgi:DNA-directed RNA polymerase III subunit RPC4